MGPLASPGSVPFLTAVSIRSALLTTTMKANGKADLHCHFFNVIAAKFSTNNDMFIRRVSTVLLYCNTLSPSHECTFSVLPSE